MAKFTPDDMMAHLDEIQGIIDGRKKATKEDLRKLKKETRHAVEEMIKFLPEDIDKLPNVKKSPKSAKTKKAQRP